MKGQSVVMSGTKRYVDEDSFKAITKVRRESVSKGRSLEDFF
ncbi:MAG: hypothetical protein WAV32_08995 [Halobacteriota archaeon]